MQTLRRSVVIGARLQPPEPRERVLGLPPAIVCLALGAVLAPCLCTVPFLSYIGWFLRSLVHEMGHTTAALVVGCSAMPAIRIDGHAATEHGPQFVPLALATWAVLGWLAWWQRKHLARCVGLGLACLVYPAIAFTGAKEAWHLIGGHLGEIAFAVVFVGRALGGGDARSFAERVASAALAWMLWGFNVWLSGGLVFSANVRSWYTDNGSFGLANDYVRLAEDIFGASLGGIGFVSLLFVLPAVPAALAWHVWRSSRDQPEGASDVV